MWVRCHGHIVIHNTTYYILDTIYKSVGLSNDGWPNKEI